MQSGILIHSDIYFTKSQHVPTSSFILVGNHQATDTKMNVYNNCFEISLFIFAGAHLVKRHKFIKFKAGHVIHQGRRNVFEHDEDRSLTASAMTALTMTALAMTVLAMTVLPMTVLPMTASVMTALAMTASTMRFRYNK